MDLDSLLRQRSDLWRGRRQPLVQPATEATGFAGLDGILPGGGWPVGALSEIVCDSAGGDALGLAIPALARLSRGEDRWIFFVSPPFIPYAPALAARGVGLRRLVWIRPPEPQGGWWAAEQALRSGACAAVLIWGQPGGNGIPRRLQLAATEGKALLWLFRAEGKGGHAAPAALRLRARPLGKEWEVTLLKCRGGWPGAAIRLAG